MPTRDKHALPAREAKANLSDYAEEKPKHAGGRPSKYDRTFHPSRLIELCEEGLSFAACAGDFRISRETIYDWADKFPEFSDAKRIGEGLAVLFWERQNITLAQTGDGNATATVFGLKNRSRKGERHVPEWQDVSRQEQTGADGGPIQHNFTAIERRIVDPKSSE
jgi:uncharacterized protein (DUF433 family)